MREAFRTLFRTPLFTLPVILLLALGIGANTLVFTAVHALLLKPLPVSKPAELYRMGVQYAPTLISYDHSVHYAEPLARSGRSFAQVFTTSVEEMSASVGNRQPESALVGEVSGNFFAALGLTAAVGRLIEAPDDGQVVVISASFRERNFGGVRDILSQTVYLRGQPFRVIGVTPRDFNGLDLDLRTDLWIPVSAVRLWSPAKVSIRKHMAQVIVRLKPGVASAQAEAELATLYPEMVADEAVLSPQVSSPADVAHALSLKTSLQPIETGVSTLRKTFRGAVAALMAGVVALLLLICANIGGLMAARAQARRRELALRMSLGATRLDLLRKAMAEGFLLSIAGTAGGLLVAWAGAPLLAAMLEQRKPLGLAFVPDAQVFAYAALACLVTTLVLGALPAFQIFSSGPALALGGATARIAGGRNVARWLVMAQVGLATLLGLSGISLDRTLAALRSQDPGFRRDHLVVMRLYPEIAGFTAAESGGVLRESIRRMESIPGVDSVSVAAVALLRGIGMKTTAGPSGSRLTFENAMNVSLNAVSENYFASLRMHLVAGRPLRASDAKAAPQPVVVSETLARQFFGSPAAALGRAIGSGRPGIVAPAASQIVGVVRDARYRTMRETPPATIYRAIDLDHAGGMALHLITSGDPNGIMRLARLELSKLGKGLTPIDMATMEREIEISLWQERMLSVLSSMFAVSAAVLAGIGLFGMLAFSVSQRTREIGVRMALGATVRSIAGIVARNALTPAVPGVALGLGMYALLSKAMLGSLLFGVKLWDPVTVAAATVGVLAVVALASALPAVRAASVDPAEALRSE